MKNEEMEISESSGIKKLTKDEAKAVLSALQRTLKFIEDIERMEREFIADVEEYGSYVKGYHDSYKFMSAVNRQMPDADALIDAVFEFFGLKKRKYYWGEDVYIDITFPIMKNGKRVYAYVSTDEFSVIDDEDIVKDLDETFDYYNFNKTPFFEIDEWEDEEE